MIFIFVQLESKPAGACVKLNNFPPSFPFENLCCTPNKKDLLENNIKKKRSEQ
jgi:hypothetical protein